MSDVRYVKWQIESQSQVPETMGLMLQNGDLLCRCVCRYG
jgi:hypothetical protein